MLTLSKHMEMHVASTHFVLCFFFNFTNWHVSRQMLLKFDSYQSGVAFINFHAYFHPFFARLSSLFYSFFCFNLL